VCVESTARDAFMRDYWVAFVADCTASTAQAAHDATLYTMGKHFATVVTGAEIAGAWAAAAQAARPLTGLPEPVGASHGD
ncbi:MAG: cysteine hydrolase, partial [Chloroflexi bacterium]|nr:cysteine hydrolase [Chloroflexota bacterium]